MTMTQTVKVPADRRIMLEVPPQIQAGETARFEVFWFPVKNEKKPMESLTREELLMRLPPEKRKTVEEEAEWINNNIEWLNKEMLETLEDQYDPFENEDE